MTKDMIDKIHRIVMKDRRVTVCDIAEAVDITIERVYNILHQKVQVTILCVPWMPFC